ncbi:hypothetical protein BGW80DRAFT_1459128 [Lactifluus volemus]|nr:hypothetical protein BGW80DRAFT_1459128 [Lactifluus volemus]
MPEKRISIIRQLVPPEPVWDTSRVPDQAGKIVIITGGNEGIGRETARMLLSKGAKVYIAARSEERSQRTITELKEETGKDSIDFLNLDLSDLASIKTAVEQFRSKETALHTLYNNTCVMYTPIEKVTAQGWDMQFGTNVLGHFYLTKLLLPVLTETAKKAPAKTVRVINVSSIGHYLGAEEGIRWSTLTPGDQMAEERKKLGSIRLFGQSKLGNILFSNELARRYGGEGIVSISLHPGTDLSRHAGSFVDRIIQLAKLALQYVVTCGDLRFLSKEGEALASSVGYERAEEHAEKDTARVHAFVEESHETTSGSSHGAITSLFAGTAPQAGELNGKYLTAWARVTLPSKKAVDHELEAKLWEWCEEKVKDI